MITRLSLLLALLASWAAAETQLGVTSGFSQTAMDSQGNIHLLYSTYDTAPVYYMRFDGSAWSEPVYVPWSDRCWHLYTRPDIVAGSDGRAHMVYGVYTGGGDPPQGFPNDLNYFFYARADDPEGSSFTTQQIGNDGYRYSQFDIVLDENDQPHISYVRTNKSAPWCWQLVYLRPNGVHQIVATAWNEAYRFFLPAIAYSNGVVHIAWAQAQEPSPSTNIWYASFNSATGGELSFQRVSNVSWGRFAGGSDMAIGPDGPEITYLVADWNGSPYYCGVYLTKPGWSDGTLLDGETAGVHEEQHGEYPTNIAFDTAGNRYVVWYFYGNNEAYYKINSQPKTALSPWGHIDVCAGVAGAYYVRTHRVPGPLYFARIGDPGTNTPPTLTMLTPPAQNAEANSSYVLSWTDADPDDNATIALFYDTDSSGFDGVPIQGAQSISEDPDGAGDQFAWNISALPDNSLYWAYGAIGDGTNPVVRSYSPGYLFVNHVNDAPTITLTAPAGADTADGGVCRITWVDDDPDDDASIKLFYSPVESPSESTLIVQGLSEDSTTDTYDWNLAAVPPGTYRIYARITDGELNGYSHSSGTITTLARATFSPTDDASVYRDWEPNLPHGDRPDLDVGADDLGVPDEMAFFRFEVTGLQYGIVHAYLRVHCVDEGGGGGVHSVNSTTWTEETLTWNNKPGIGGSPVSTISWVYPGTWYAYEVTSLLMGNGVYAFALRSAEPNGAHWASKEYGTAGLRPYLEILMSGDVPELPPTAVIDSIIPNPVIQGFHQTVGFWGRGWDNDEGGSSVLAWRWDSDLDGQIGASASFALAPPALSVGIHAITLKVEDDEGVWSLPDTSYLDVRAPDGLPPAWPNGTGILAVADLADGGSVRLFWNEAADENPPIRYNVYHNDSSPAFSGTCLENVSWTQGIDYSCTYDVADLPVNVARYFGIRAVDLVGNEDTNAVELVCTPSDNGPPSFVQDPTVSDITYGSARISWSTDEPTTGKVGYWTGPADSTAVEDSNLTCEHSIILAGLEATTLYYFRVHALDSSINEVVSAIDTFTTAALPIYTCLPTDDSYVSSAEPDANFGGSTLLLVSAGQIAYLRFLVPEVGEIVGAELRIVAATSGDTATVWPVVSTTWEEETITWNTRPFLGGSVVGGIPAQSPAQMCVVNLSTYITEPGSYSLAVNGPPARGGAFYSKEHTVESQRPTLAVWYQGDLMPPSAPPSLSCTVSGPDVLLTWQPAADDVGVSGYHVYRGYTPFFVVVPRTLIATTETTQFTDPGVLGNPDVDLYYVVTAFDGVGNESTPSNRVGVKEFEIILVVP